MDVVLGQREQIAGGEGAGIQCGEDVAERGRRRRCAPTARLVGRLARHPEDVVDQPFGHRGDGEVGRRRQEAPLLAVGRLRLDGDAPPATGVGPEVGVDASAVIDGVVGGDCEQRSGVPVENPQPLDGGQSLDQAIGGASGAGDEFPLSVVAERLENRPRRGGGLQRLGAGEGGVDHGVARPVHGGEPRGAVAFPAAAEQNRGALGCEAVLVQVRRDARDARHAQVPPRRHLRPARFGPRGLGPERQHQPAEAGVDVQPDPRVVACLEPCSDLGHRVDHPVRVRRGRAHDEHRPVIDRREELVGGHPARRRVHLDADEPQTQQVRGLAERGVHGDRGDDRPAAAGLPAGHLPGGQAGEHAALGPAGSDAAVDRLRRAAEDRPDTVDDPPVDRGDRGEHRGVETVDPVRQPGGAGRQLVEFLQSRVVHVRQDPAAGRRRIQRPERGQPGQGVLSAVGDLEGQGIGGHVRSVHRG